MKNKMGSKITSLLPMFLFWPNSLFTCLVGTESEFKLCYIEKAKLSEEIPKKGSFKKWAIKFQLSFCECNYEPNSSFSCSYLFWMCVYTYRGIWKWNRHWVRKCKIVNLKVYLWIWNIFKRTIKLLIFTICIEFLTQIVIPHPRIPWLQRTKDPVL